MNTLFALFLKRHSVKKMVAGMLFCFLFSTVWGSFAHAAECPFSEASEVPLHSKTPGFIRQAGECYYYQFTPSSSETYLIYTTGPTDTVGTLYKAGSTSILKENDDSGISGNNFAIQYHLTAGQTYYIKVCGHSNHTGAYTLVVSKAFYHSSINSDNQDARRVQMQVEGASVLTKLKVKTGKNTYTLNKSASGHLDTIVNGARFKVIFEPNNNGLSTNWSIEADIPPTAIGTAETVNFTFSSSNGFVNIYGPSHTGLIAYKSSIKTGINPESNLQALLNSMAQSGYSLTVRNWDNTLVVVTSSTKAATGMKIIKTTTDGKIVEVLYLVIFGDIWGFDSTAHGTGDGEINSIDALSILQQSVGKMELNGFTCLAADVDHSGTIDSLDAQWIYRYLVGVEDIPQNDTIFEVPDDCYYISSVTF